MSMTGWNTAGLEISGEKEKEWIGGCVSEVARVAFDTACFNVTTLVLSDSPILDVETWGVNHCNQEKKNKSEKTFIYSSFSTCLY